MLFALLVSGTDGKLSCMAAYLVCQTIFSSIIARAGGVNVRKWYVLIQDSSLSAHIHMSRVPPSICWIFYFILLQYYDIRKKCEGSLCYDFSNLEKFLNQKPVRAALGVGDIEFVSCSTTVYQAMIMDWMRNLEVGIPALLEDGVKLLVYAGEYDLICNWLGQRLFYFFI